jgi:pyrroline-5-carboxylate reductase
MTVQTIGFIGGGNMARSLIGGLINNGWDRGALYVSDPDAGARDAMASVLGVQTRPENAAVAAAADVLVLAVKPQVLKPVALELAHTVQQRRPLVISIAAGIRTDAIDRWLGGNVRLVRAMPNTPALIGSGASGLFATANASGADRDVAESLLRAVGIAVWLSDEALMDVVTALSGSGPAYFFYVMEALEAAAVKSGLDARTARLLTLETAFGAAKMALENGEEPAALRQRVTSPGGTTEAAIRSFEDSKLRTSFENAIQAATQRSRELAKLLGEE